MGWYGRRTSLQAIVTSLEFSVPYDLDELVDSYLLHSEVTKKAAGPWKIFLFLSTAFLGVFVLLAITKAGLQLKDAIWAVPTALALGALAAWLPLRFNRPSVKRSLKGHWDQLKREGQQCTYRFDADRITIIDKVTGGELEWPEVHAWHESERFLLIYRSPQFYYYIVKQRVDSETLASLIAKLALSAAKQI